MKRDRDSDRDADRDTDCDSDSADQPLKKRCRRLTFVDDEDMDRLRGEIADIKESIRKLDVLLDGLLQVYDN